MGLLDARPPRIILLWGNDVAEELASAALGGVSQSAYHPGR